MIGHLKIQLSGIYTFGGQRGILSNPLNPPAYRPVFIINVGRGHLDLELIHHCFLSEMQHSSVVKPANLLNVPRQWCGGESCVT